MKVVAVFLVLLWSAPCFAESVEWLRDYDQALLKSKETGKPVFLDSFADWCVWCHKMDEEAYSDGRLIAFLQDYIPLRIDIEDRGKGAEVAERYQVKTLPSFIVLDSNGSVLNRIRGYLSAEELMAEIAMIQELLVRERMNPEDWQAIRILGEEYLFRDMTQEAELRFVKILQRSDSDSLKEPVHFALALAVYYQGRAEEALEILNRYLEVYVDGEAIEDVLLLRAQIFMEMDQKEKARKVLEQFLIIFPQSESAPRVREVLENLN